MHCCQDGHVGRRAKRLEEQEDWQTKIGIFLCQVSGELMIKRNRKNLVFHQSGTNRAVDRRVTGDKSLLQSSNRLVSLISFFIRPLQPGSCSMVVAISLSINFKSNFKSSPLSIQSIFDSSLLIRNPDSGSH